MPEAKPIWSDKPDQASVPASRPRTVRPAINGTAAIRIVDVQKAKTHLSALLPRVASGGRVLPARHGQPCSPLIPLEPEPWRELGFLRGSVDESVFDPLPEDERQRWGA